MEKNSKKCIVWVALSMIALSSLSFSAGVILSEHVRTFLGVSEIDLPDVSEGEDEYEQSSEVDESGKELEHDDKENAKVKEVISGPTNNDTSTPGSANVAP